MKKTADWIYSFSFHTLRFIGIFTASLLFLSAFLFSSTDTDISTLITFVTPDNLLIGIIGLAVFTGILFLLKFAFKKNPERTMRIALAVTLGSYAIFGTIFILLVKSMPHTDSYFVYEIARAFAENNYEQINPASYLSVYPHQIGLLFFYEPLLRFWNLFGSAAHGYIFLQFINLILALICIFCFYKIIRKLFDNNYTAVCFLFMLWLFIPLYFYVLRIYGDLPSLCFFTIGIWAFTEVLLNKTGKTWLWGILSVICFFFSVATRKNSIIAIIAVAIILLLVSLYQKRGALLLLLLSYIFVAIFTLPVIQSFYEMRADNQLDEGTPPIAYIAMGMQPAPKANGWYNAFNYNVYVESGHNLDFITTYSQSKIKSRVAHFKENPSDAFDFYFEKFVSQWCDGTYAFRELTAYTTSTRIPVFEALYTKAGNNIWIFLCNQLQTIIYFGTLVFCFMNSKKQNLLPFLFVLISFGGLLFHFMWEANSRAIFAYTFLLLPVSGAGFSGLFEKNSIFRK